MSTTTTPAPAHHLPRGHCTICDQEVALRKGGLVREHKSRDADTVCSGSGDPARETITPAVALTLEGTLAGAGIPRAGEATVRRALDKIGVDGAQPPTAEQTERLVARMEGRAKAGLTGPAAITWIVTGESSKEQAQKERLEDQMKRSPAKPRSTSRATRAGAGDVDQSDVDAARLGYEAAGSKGRKLSQRVTSTEARKARVYIATRFAELVRAGKLPNAPENATGADLANLVPTILGFKSERAFRQYVIGEVSRPTDDEATAGIRGVKAAINSHQCWARKAGAAAFGVMLQMRETTKAAS